MLIGLTITEIYVYMLVFVRLSGMIAFNPLLSRNNVPARVRVGLVIFLMLLVAPMQNGAGLANMGSVGFFFAVVRELFIGLVFGYIFQIFYYFLFYVGDMMDTDFGISMAKSFDPATNIQVSFSASLVTAIFTLYIFISGSHLALIKLFAESFTWIQLGGSSLSLGIITFVIELFSSVFLLAIRLWAPFVVAEFILQMSMGILMKFIPQISVFVINFQLRIVLGMLMLFAFAPLIGQFIDNYIVVLFDNLSNAVQWMGG